MKFGMSYFGNRFIDHARKDMEFLKEIGVSYVVHTFSERDMRFSKRTMKMIFDITHENGMEVWADPWAFGWVFGGEEFSAFLLENRDEWQMTNTGEYSPNACLRSMKFRNLMKEWIDTVKECGADVVLWDEPHFRIPKEDELGKVWTCRCEKCMTEFKAKYGFDMPTEMTEEVMEFRDNTIVEFLKELMDYAKSRGLRNAVCFLPLEGGIVSLRDVEKVVSLDSLDTVGSDPYWFSFERFTGMGRREFVEYWVKKIQKLAMKYGKDTHFWVQAFKVPAGREEELVDGVKQMMDLGVDNVAFWGYRACEPTSFILPDDPEKVWNMVVEIIRRFHS